MHKDGLPLHPILPSIGTCGCIYGLAKFLVPHLEPLTRNEFTVKDSFSFSDEITKFDSADQLIMASFDIKSLFTNIPLEEKQLISALILCMLKTKVSSLSLLINLKNFSSYSKTKTNWQFRAELKPSSTMPNFHIRAVFFVMESTILHIILKVNKLNLLHSILY